MGEKEWAVRGKNGCELAKMNGGWQEKGGSVINGWYLVKTGGIWRKQEARKWVVVGGKQVVVMKMGGIW